MAQRSHFYLIRGKLKHRERWDKRRIALYSSYLFAICLIMVLDLQLKLRIPDKWDRPAFGKRVEYFVERLALNSEIEQVKSMFLEFKDELATLAEKLELDKDGIDEYFVSRFLQKVKDGEAKSDILLPFIIQHFNWPRSISAIHNSKFCEDDLIGEAILGYIKSQDITDVNQEVILPKSGMFYFKHRLTLFIIFLLLAGAIIGSRLLLHIVDP